MTQAHTGVANLKPPPFTQGKAHTHTPTGLYKCVYLSMFTDSYEGQRTFTASRKKTGS